MITKINVDGFKSLSKFELNLKTGINILVGTNGAGKTNIILFFEFLSQLSKTQVGNAVSSVGGAGSIFKKLSENEYQEDITFKIYGSRLITSRQSIVYEYKAIVKISKEKDNIYFSKQEIKIRTGSKFWDNPDSRRYDAPWDLSLSFDYIESEKESRIVIKQINKKRVAVRYYTSDSSQSTTEDRLKRYISDSNPSENMFVSSLQFVYEHANYILSDLNGGETFNVVPSKVKEQEDAATNPGIRKDGSGLATTLYAIKNGKPISTSTNFGIHFYLYRPDQPYDKFTFRKIVSYLKLANRTITNMDVQNDPFDNKLIVKISIQNESFESVLPLSSMSDGTIKWLALITAILTSKTIFSIEEPENFLHPWMQAQILKIMRTHLEDKKEQSFVLMTTHSESLLNASRPEEIIIVSFKGGSTKASRILNIESLKEEISNSGYGLGSFYFSNSLEDE